MAVKTESSASAPPPHQPPSLPPTSIAKSRDDVIKRDASDDVINDDASRDVSVATTLTATTATTATTTTATATAVGPGTKFENAFLQYLAKHTATTTATSVQVRLVRIS